MTGGYEMSIIENVEHNRKCNAKCQEYDEDKYCAFRQPVVESPRDYRFRMYEMRDDVSFSRVITRESGEVIKSVVKRVMANGSLGRCGKDHIITLGGDGSRTGRGYKKRVMVGGVL